MLYNTMLWSIIYQFKKKKSPGTVNALFSSLTMAGNRHNFQGNNG